MVIALAGRRIDASDAETPRFPLQNVPLVTQRLAQLFEHEAPTAVVSSAACGADLVALNVAGKRRARRRVVLPFNRDRFRLTSVADRPGNWEAVYDRVLAELDLTGDLITLEGRGEGTAAYAAVNEVILREAAALARKSNANVMAVLVWEGASRGSGDLTAAFGEEASKRGLHVRQVLTL